MKTITRDNITLTVAVNSDGTVDLNSKMKAVIAESDGGTREFEAYPTVGENGKTGMIDDQFNYVRSDIRFEEIYNRRMSGYRISEIRKTKGLSQTELAEKVGTSQEHISRIEKGLYSPRLDISAKIADVLGCKVDDFLK